MVSFHGSVETVLGQNNVSGGKVWSGKIPAARDNEAGLPVHVTTSVYQCISKQYKTGFKFQGGDVCSSFTAVTRLLLMMMVIVISDALKRGI